MDITMILDCLIKLGCALIITFIIPWIKEHRDNEKFSNAIQVTEEVIKIASSVVYAANELEITGELLALGKTKAEYALEMAEKELADRNIVYDKELLTKEIKAAVTQLRVEIQGTNAQKKNEE